MLHFPAMGICTSLTAPNRIGRQFTSSSRRRREPIISDRVPQAPHQVSDSLVAGSVVQARARRRADHLPALPRRCANRRVSAPAASSTKPTTTNSGAYGPLPVKASAGVDAGVELGEAAASDAVTAGVLLDAAVVGQSVVLVVLLPVGEVLVDPGVELVVELGMVVTSWIDVPSTVDVVVVEVLVEVDVLVDVDVLVEVDVDVEVLVDVDDVLEVDVLLLEVGVVLDVGVLLDVDVLVEVEELGVQAAVVVVVPPVPAVVEVDELVGLVVLVELVEDVEVSNGRDGVSATVPRRGAAPDGLAPVSTRPPPPTMAATPDMQSRHALRLATFPLPRPFPQEKYGERH